MNILEKFKDVNVLIVGDIMLDRYWWGSVDRISPEAPVPVIGLKKTTLVPGGAANVAANVAGLGASVYLVGVTGNDAEADLLANVLEPAGVSTDHILRISDRPTTVKTRVIAHNQQVARIDSESGSALSADDEGRIIETADKLIAEVNTVVVSDYAKGLLTEKLLRHLIDKTAAAGKKILIDPKGRDYSKYHGATLLTPNKREAAHACNFEENGHNVIDTAGRKLIEDYNVNAVLITQGEDGMTLFEQGAKPRFFNALAREVYDVTGAGDTVIGTLAASIGAGSDLGEAANLANIAAGVVVEQIGTSAITLKDLKTAIINSQAN